MTATLKGVAALLALSVSTIVLTLFLCLVAVFKLLAPKDAARDRIGAAGRRAVEQLTWERNAACQLEIYRRLVRRDHRDVEEHH